MSLLVALCLLLAEPPPPDIQPPQLPPIQSIEHRSGARAWLVERHGVAAVESAMLWPLGPSAEPEEQAGLASVATATLLHGSERDPTGAEGVWLERRARDLDFSVSESAAWLTFAVRPEDQHGVWSTLGTVLGKPRVPSEGVTRAVRRRTDWLKAEEGEADLLARRLWFRLLLDRHPLARSRFGTERSLRGLTRDEVDEFIDRWLTPNRARLFVAGDTTAKELHRALRGAIESWDGRRPESTGRTAELPEGQALLLVHRTGAEQARIVAGFATEPAPAALRPGLHLLESALALPLTGRLDAVLREDHQMTYGVSTQLLERPEATLLRAEASVQMDRAAQAVTLIRHELAALTGARPLTLAELDRARHSVWGAASTAFSTNAGAIGLLASESIAGRDPGSLQERLDGLAAVTPDDVTAAAKFLLRDPQLAVVVIGDADVLEGPLRATGLPLVITGR